MFKYTDTSKKQPPVIAQLTLAELETRILTIRQLVGPDQCLHLLPPADRKYFDQMRKRAEALRKQGHGAGHD